MKKIFHLILLTLLITACTQENIPTNTCNYTVLLKKEYFVNNNEFLASDSAKVTLKIANEIYERYTDSMLTANFTTIKSGTALVTIDYPNFCIVKYKITLPDESSLSSQINLLPKEGEFAAILKGELQTTGGKTITEPLNIIVTPADSIKNYVSGQNIYDIYIENFSRSTIKSASGSYNITLPATSNGTKYIINADGFMQNGTAYEFNCDTITLFSGKTTVKNLIYK